MSTAPVTRYTPAQYLERERKALTKSEYQQPPIAAAHDVFSFGGQFGLQIADCR